MIYRFLIIVLVSCFCLIGITDEVNARRPYRENTSYKPVFMSKLKGDVILLGDSEKPPREPFLSENDFLKYPPLRSVEERVSRLLHGIVSDIQPEYDHYGYEIRRYMAHTGNIKIYEDQDYLKKQISNAKVAFIIAEYWEKYIRSEIDEIGTILDEDQREDNVISFQARTAFRQNKVKVQGFLISLKGWIIANEEMLRLVNSNFSEFKLVYPEVMVRVAENRINFYNAITSRQVKLKEIKKYVPFSIMVY